MFQLKELIICKTNMLKIPAVQYFAIAFKKRFKSTDTAIEKNNHFKDKVKQYGSNPSVKYCLLMGYSGAKYWGMQYQNYKIPTIENVLLKAMLDNKWIAYEAYKKPFQVDFIYGSRTDRGVSAMTQCCSIFLRTGLNIEDLNKTLPDDVRVFGMKRVPARFNARHYCDCRTYTYTLPTIAFSHYNDQSPQRGYRVSAHKLAFINELLQIYNGNKNYHNFTADKTFSDQSSYREILNAECEAPFIVDDVEFCTIRLRGKSFMTHQIRKMLGLMLAVAREVTDSSVYDMVFTDRQINCPTAPGLGLVLNRQHFDWYDQKYGSRDYEKLTWEKCEDDVQEFFVKQIESKIVQQEISRERMYEWLETLLNYPYVPEENNNELSGSHKTYI